MRAPFLTVQYLPIHHRVEQIQRGSELGDLGLSNPYNFDVILVADCARVIFFLVRL